MATNRNLEHRVRAALYSLKREYGGRIDIYKKGAVTSDPKTGVKTTAKTVTVVKRAICLPGTIDRNEVRGISYISANKTTVVGGQYDINTRDFIVDRRDVKGSLPDLTEDDWLVFEGKKYQIKKFWDFEFDTGWVIQAKAILGEVPEQVHLLSVDHLLNLTQAAGT